MGDGYVAIVASHYGDTVDAIKADPVMQRMANEVIQGIIKGEDIKLYETNWTLMTLRGYSANGGTVQGHIGGPVEALRAIVGQRLAAFGRAADNEEFAKSDPEAHAECAQIRDAMKRALFRE